MGSRLQNLDSRLTALRREMDALRASLRGTACGPVDRWSADADALRFHLTNRLLAEGGAASAGQAGAGTAAPSPVIVVIIGGTGTGKSTLVNRLMGDTLSATSFRRTFTSGPVAVLDDPSALPKEWLGLPRMEAPKDELPARGRTDALMIVPAPGNELTAKITLVDTPDVDGDEPLHQALADRAFRWAQAVVFLVTPEKYQMTELLPYYRLANRYALPAAFVMNKCEEPAMLTDYATQLAARGWGGAPLCAIPRDDAMYEPPPRADLAALRTVLLGLSMAPSAQRDAGLESRAVDLLGRLMDQVIVPLRHARREARRLIDAIHSTEQPEASIDVNPVTQQLRRRLQHRSVLYLMGPTRVLKRLRQAPGLLIRLPRTIWDMVVRGKELQLDDPEIHDPDKGGVPNFRAILTDQFSVVQSRIDDVLRGNPDAARWLQENPDAYQAARIDPREAGRIVESEMDELRIWLEQRWNATPRDTLLLMKLLKYLPGGKKLTKWTEAAPYLLVLVLAAAHHAVFGGLDLLVVGGFSLATWLGERLSNEVTARTRDTNRKIAQRFSELVHSQVVRVCTFLEEQAPSDEKLDLIEKLATEINDSLQDDNAASTAADASASAEPVSANLSNDSTAPPPPADSSSSSASSSSAPSSETP